MEEKRVDVAHGTITYLSHGQGPLLVFLHGVSVTPRVYIPLFELLGEHYTIFAPTHPGHGDSFRLPRSWTIEDFVATYCELFAVLNLEPTVIVGHSFGGLLALLLGAAGIGNSVVAFDPAGMPFTLTPKAYLAAKKKEAKDLLSYANDRDRVKKTLSAAGELFYTAIKRFDDLRLLLPRISNTDICEEVKNLSIPVTLCWGEDDGIVPLSVGEGLAKMITQATLIVFPNKGHTYPVTDPEFTYQELMKAIQNMRV
jgi:pimeloyl-ACP methyl ester carboxylesterase